MKTSSNPLTPTVYSFRDVFETDYENDKPVLFEFFSLVDEAMRLAININHTPDSNRLTICPNQLIEVSTHLKRATIDIEVLKGALHTIKYPRFDRQATNIRTQLWNNQLIDVWTFELHDHQLTPPLSHDDTANDEANIELATDKLLNLRSYVSVWRDSISAVKRHKTVQFNAEDLSSQLHHIQNQITKAIKLIR